jgi:hypothetical protein
MPDTGWWSEMSLCTTGFTISYTRSRYTGHEIQYVVFKEVGKGAKMDVILMILWLRYFPGGQFLYTLRSIPPAASGLAHNFPL